MKILDRDHAQNWAAKLLRFPFVLVDEDGNTHCLTKVADAVAIVKRKREEKKTVHIVKGKLPGIDVHTIEAAAVPETPTVEPETPNDAAK